AVLNTNRQLGILVGVAIIGLILGSTSNWYEGLHIALGVIAAAYLLASVTALTVARGTHATTAAPGASVPDRVAR
ncbi:MAG TPA: hypothetical protein VGD15_17200, partial [Kribbella sp.]